MKMIKFVSIGEVNIGKTRFFQILNEIDSIKEYIPTIGVNYFSFNRALNDNMYKCRFWDTGGGEMFVNLIKTYVEGCDCCILFFDYNKVHTIKYINENIEKIKNYNPDIHFIAIGFNYNHYNLNDLNLVSFVKLKKEMDKLRSLNIKTYQLVCFKRYYIYNTMIKLIEDYVEYCNKENILIKDKELSFGDNEQIVSEKNWFQKFITCCFF